MPQFIGSQKIPAILPVALTEYGSLNHKRIKILFFSLQKCHAQNWLDRIYIITPSHQRQIIAEVCEDIDFLNIDIIDEDELFPELKKYKDEGYKKQMLIKLGSHKLFDSEFFITLDSDIICLQTITIDRLIADGKALLNYEDKNAHPDWWEASAEILSVPLDYSSPGMGVTPAILSRTICEYALQEIEHKFQRSWISVLMEFKKDWTEYSLYFLCAQKTNCLRRYHLGGLDSKNISLIDTSYTIWFADDIQKLDNLHQHSLPSGLFAVLQSNTYISLDTILNYLPIMLRLSPDDPDLLKLHQEIY